MINFRVFSICLLLAICNPAMSQPKFSISTIVGRNSISENDVSKIQQYATGWAAALQTTDTLGLLEAQRKLIEPLKPDVGMSRYARSLYGKALKDAFGSILGVENENEMAAVNAIQVLSLLGTDQACSILLKHANSTEDRPSLRLWASVGLGTSYQLGILPTNRIITNAKILADYASREIQWYTIARQFDSLTALQNVPNINSMQSEELVSLSLELQCRAFIELVQDIKLKKKCDDRVRALPFVLPSLRLQLIEPGIDEAVRLTAQKILVPELISFVSNSVKVIDSAKDDSDLNEAYADSIQTANLIISRALKLSDSSDVSLRDLWISNDTKSINEIVSIWNSAINN